MAEQSKVASEINTTVEVEKLNHKGKTFKKGETIGLTKSQYERYKKHGFVK